MCRQSKEYVMYASYDSDVVFMTTLFLNLLSKWGSLSAVRKRSELFPKLPRALIKKLINLDYLVRV